MMKDFTLERLTKVVAVFGVLVTLPFISASLPAALFVPQYPGDSQMEGREGSNEVLSMSHDVRVQFDPATGLPNGSGQHGPLYVTKIVDRSTTGFYKALGDTERLEEVTLDFYRLDPKTRAEVLTYSIELKNARIVSIETTLQPEDDASLPEETVGFVYEEVTWTWVPTGDATIASWSRR